METVFSVLGFLGGGHDVPHRPQGCCFQVSFHQILYHISETPWMAESAYAPPQFPRSVPVIFSFGVRVGSQKGDMSAVIPCTNIPISNNTVT